MRSEDVVVIQWLLTVTSAKIDAHFQSSNELLRTGYLKIEYFSPITTMSDGFKLTITPLKPAGGLKPGLLLLTVKLIQRR